MLDEKRGFAGLSDLSSEINVAGIITSHPAHPPTPELSQPVTEPTAGNEAEDYTLGSFQQVENVSSHKSASGIGWGWILRSFRGTGVTFVIGLFFIIGVTLAIWLLSTKGQNSKNQSYNRPQTAQSRNLPQSTESPISPSVPFRGSEIDTSKNPMPQITREAQKLLSGLGYKPGPVDGFYGSRTKKAVINFQRDLGVVQNGEIDQQLINSLQEQIELQNKKTTQLADSKNESSSAKEPGLRSDHAHEKPEVPSVATLAAWGLCYVKQNAPQDIKGEVPFKCEGLAGRFMDEVLSVLTDEIHNPSVLACVYSQDLEKLVVAIAEVLWANQKNPLYTPGSAIFIATQVVCQNAAKSGQKADKEARQPHQPNSQMAHVESVATRAPTKQSSNNNSPLSSIKASSGASRPLMDQPLPPSGNVQSYTSAEKIAPFEINAAKGTNHLVKLVDTYTKAPVMTVFVRSGTRVNIDVPLGTYEVRYASGTSWYGDEYLFGPDTAYSKADRTFKFEVFGNQVSGFTITLYKVANGNLQTSAIRASEF